MEREKRIEFLTKLKEEKKPYGSMEIWYQNKLDKLPVYEIDLNYLIYNPYNGRIASLVKTYEKKTGQSLDPINKNDIKKIEDFLWISNIQSNKNTEKSIEDQGQKVYGIVTKDGVIVDGNRRAMIIKKVQEKPCYFKAVILDETLEENPKEIKRLETTYQMGEDAKVDYNAIEKYLKCKDLIEEDFSEKDIATMMGEKETKIKEYLSIMKLMNDYLEKLGYSGIYTRLDKTEGAFVDLNRYLNRYENRGPAMVDWNCDKSDITDLKLIYYDYIQYIYNKGKKKDSDDGILGSGDSKDYRFIGKPSKKESFFCSEKIWKDFRDSHFNEIEPIKKEFETGEYSIDNLRKKNQDTDLDQLLKQRDAMWAGQTGNILKKNLAVSRNNLENQNAQNEPEELLRKALSAIEAVNIESKSFLEKEEVEILVMEINSCCWNFKQAIEKYNKRKTK